jgi:Trk-type K+ transport system membrane component
VFNYSLSTGSLLRIFSILVLSTGTLALGLLLLAVFEYPGMRAQGFLPYLFEQASAFGTVGLSSGSFLQSNVSLARDFSIGGKCVMIATMIIGRAGVLSVVAAILRRREKVIEYVEGKYIVG